MSNNHKDYHYYSIIIKDMEKYVKKEFSKGARLLSINIDIELFDSSFEDNLFNLRTSIEKKSKDTLFLKTILIENKNNLSGLNLRGMIHNAQKNYAINNLDKNQTEKIYKVLAKNNTWQIPTISIYKVPIYKIFKSKYWIRNLKYLPKETAENLRKHGGYVPGVRPGERTAYFIEDILTKLTTIGAAYLTLVCLMPEFLISKFPIPFYLGGTSVLIVVVVAMDTVTQVQTRLMSQQYESLIRKTKFGK